MPQKKSTQINSYHDKTILESVLWFIENYLPQKKKKSSHEEFLLDTFESFTINKIKKIASARSKSLKGDMGNTKITFTVGKWALPYLNLFKMIKLIK